MGKPAKKAWGDEDDELDSESRVDANGIKERVRITENSRGQKVRQVMKIKVAESKVKTPRRVEGRKNLPRFGEAVEGEQNVTLLSKETIAKRNDQIRLLQLKLCRDL